MRGDENQQQAMFSYVDLDRRVPTNHPLRAIRSERQLMERIQYDLLFRWFVGFGIDEQEWDATVFTKNRDRLMEGEVAQRLLGAVMEQARNQDLLSEEHFTVDGTILEAWASRSSFVPKEAGTGVGTGRVEGSVCGTRMSRRATRKHACIRRTPRAKPNPVIWGM